MKSTFHKNIMLKGLCLIYLLILLVGCSSRVDITGEVFIEEESGVKKLPLTKIQIVSKEKFVEHIKSRLRKAKSEEKSLTKSLEILKNYNQKFDSLATRSAKLLMKDEADAIVEYIVDVSRSIRILESELQGIKDGGNIIYYTEDIIGSIGKTEANSTGKFAISIDHDDQQYILIAVKDDLAWAIFIKPKDGKLNISLNNKNLSDSKCEVCVFKKGITPKTLSNL